MKDSVEALVASYLDRRDADPSLTPESFARAYPAVEAALVAAIGDALGIESLLAPARAAPEAIGPYRVVRVIGRGGMGVVYEVERDGERFALKVLPHAPLLGPAALERFQREARVLAQLDEPGVVRVVDTGAEEGLPYLVMELVRGRPLSALDAPLASREAARVALAVARAVAALHARGVVHRDVKPQNVMLREDGGAPVLLDFGLVAASGETSLTASGAVLGTPRYMAPEQALGRSSDERTDVHGIGLVLYELATGRPARPEASRDATLRLASNGRVTPLRRAGRRIPRELARVIGTAIAREPGRRYGSAREMADDLERFLAGTAVRGRPPGPLARASDAARRDPKRAGIVAAAALALAALGSYAVPALLDRRPARDEAALAEHLDRALCAWLLGEEGFAAREVEAAARLDAASAGAIALQTVLGLQPAIDARDRAPEGRGLMDGLAALGGGDGESALAALAPLARESPFAAAAFAEAQRIVGRSADARATIQAARPDAASTLALDAVSAMIARDVGPEATALEAFRDASARAPGFAPLRAALAGELFAAGLVDEAVRAAADAARELQHTEPEGEAWLPLLLQRVTTGPEAREVLGALLVEHSGDEMLWFTFACSWDDDHELHEAERAYLKTLELDPTNERAGLYLAHLYGGAQMGACERCDAAYAAAPEMRDFDKAAQVLVGVLETDRGRDPELPGRVVQAALDLRKHGASERPVRLVVAALDRVLAAPDTPPAARPRLVDGRRRLRDALGED